MTLSDEVATAEVLTRIEGAAGRITLNRPKALHALTRSMCEAITQALLAWRHDPAVSLVLIDHAGERGFCAGGDIRVLAQSQADGGQAALAFFRTEYQLNHLLFTYPKPTVAIMDGVVMGGGVGLAMPCRYRVATERTRFAMPETAIGLFPDVGGGWHLPRLPRRTGYWLGLTGARIGAGDCLDLGIASHFVNAEAVAALKAGLCSDRQASQIDDRLDQAGVAPPPGEARPHLQTLEAAFQPPNLDQVIERLRSGDAWARGQAEILDSRCPASLAVTWRHLQQGGQARSFAEVMRQELRIAGRMVLRADFVEGVRAVVVEKDNAPRWSPPRLDDVSEDLVQAIFAPLHDAPEWAPLD